MTTVYVIILILLAGALSYGFYWGYKKNMEIMKETAKALEEYFTPAKKYYRWLGGVVGFEAEYFLLDGKRIHITLLLLPRHAILFYPISLLINKHDRLLFRGKLDLSLVEEKQIVKRLPNGEVVVKMRPRIEDIRKIRVV